MYTITNFGLERTRDYLNGLRQRFGDLAERPTLGFDGPRASDDFMSDCAQPPMQEREGM